MKKFIYLTLISLSIIITLILGKFYYDYQFSREHPIQAEWNYFNGDSNWYISLNRILSESDNQRNQSPEANTSTGTEKSTVEEEIHTDTEITNSNTETQTETASQDQTTDTSLIEEVQNELYDLSDKGYYCDWNSISNNTPQVVYLNGKESTDENSNNYAMDIQYALNHNFHISFEDSTMKKIMYIDTKEYKD